MTKSKDIFDDMFAPLPGWLEWIAVVLFLLMVFALFI